LIDALRWLKNKGKIIDLPLHDFLAAVSVGMIKGKKVLDLNAEIDNHADVDMNVVMTGSGKLVEIQGTAEKVPFTINDLNELLSLATVGIKKIVEIQKKNIGSLK
jgi:ribonuclease PH